MDEAEVCRTRARVSRTEKRNVPAPSPFVCAETDARPGEAPRHAHPFRHLGSTRALSRLTPGQERAASAAKRTRRENTRAVLRSTRSLSLSHPRPPHAHLLFFLGRAPDRPDGPLYSPGSRGEGGRDRGRGGGGKDEERAAHSLSPFSTFPIIFPHAPSLSPSPFRNSTSRS